jgi:transposase InsO family protein
MDNVSRRILAVRIFRRNPTSEQVQHLFEDLIVSLGKTPKYIISDQGQQFRERYRDWCATWNVKPRFGAIGQHGSIAIVERAILTLKSEGLRWLPVVPLGIAAMQDEVDCFVRWYDQHRPHQTLGGETPAERYGGLPPARAASRYEPRAKYLSTYRVPNSAPAAVRGARGTRLELVVQPFEGRRHLPIVELRVAA